MSVELVTVQASDGVRLDGALAVADAVAPALPFDAAILVHGVGGNFYAPSYFAAVAENLIAAGCSVLRVNTRGHDLMYNSAQGRLGAAYETVSDCVLDLRAWLDFAASRGLRRIALWGHSLGALKTIHFLAAGADPRVVCAVTTSPPLFSFEAYGRKQGADRFLAVYEQAKALVDRGEPESLMSVTIPTNLVLAARTYIDKYGGEQYNILDLLPRVTAPILVTVGSREGAGPDAADWFTFGGMASRLDALAQVRPNLEFALIEGAAHSYAGRHAQLWSTVRAWAEGIAVAVPGR